MDLDEVVKNFEKVVYVVKKSTLNGITKKKDCTTSKSERCANCDENCLWAGVKFSWQKK